jgi:hypothetical protein
MVKTTVDSGKNDGSTVEIDLKDPRLAAFLAWLVPGLGHIYQGRTGKGILFSVCILGTFFYGLYIGGGRVVYASTADFFSRPAQGDAPRRFGFAAAVMERWQYVCQAGVGLPAMPALVQRARIRNHKQPLFGDNFMRPPYDAKYPPPNADFLDSKDQTVEPEEIRIVQNPDELSKWNYDLGENFEIGTVFTVIAGLLNIIVIFDAYGGPLIIPALEKKPEDDKDKTK